MKRSLVPVVLVLVLAPLASGLMLLAGARWATPPAITGPLGEDGRTARTRGWFTPRGYHGHEVDLGSGRQFTWTGPQADLRVASIDRRREYRVTFDIAAGRGAADPLPQLTLSVDGVPRLRTAATNEPRSYTVTTPISNASSLVIRVAPSTTFTPGPNDRRALGVIVNSVSIEPIDAPFMPTLRVLMLAALAALLYGVAAIFVGFSLPATAAVVVVVGAANTWLLLQDGAFLNVYVDRLVRVALGVAAMGACLGLLRRRWPTIGGAPEWTQAVGLVLIPSAVKFSVLWHPRTPIGDALFHVHRAELVDRGNYFFTSITPQPFFEFPYAIALYVNAMPFWNSFRDDASHVLLLRGIALASDALVGVALYFVLRRAWPNRWTAMSAAALWPFAHISIHTLCTANLTNVYGQGMFSLGLAIVAWLAAAGSVSVAGLVAATLLVSVGFLSHFSTLSVGVPLVFIVATALVVGGRAAARRLGVRVGGTLVAALAIAYGLYYSRFHPIYEATFSRVVSGEGADESGSMVAPLSEKLAQWMNEASANFSLPLVAAAMAGVFWLWARERRSPVTLVFAAWALTWVAFSALGVFTAIQMRANLAVAPVAIGFAAVGIGMFREWPRIGRPLAISVVLAISWMGFAEWMICLTGRR